MVLFYYDEEYLYNSITRYGLIVRYIDTLGAECLMYYLSFAAPCLVGGGGAIIIATRAHILSIEAKLRERQIDVEKKKQK
jgi:hypothetical protein